MSVTHGDPEGMRAVANHFDNGPHLDGKVNRYPTAPCGNGLDECGPLFAADLTSTDQLQGFLTQVSQGFYAFRTMIAQCAALYANGRAASTEELTSLLNKPSDPGLPARASVFQKPLPVPDK